MAQCVRKSLDCIQQQHNGLPIASGVTSQGPSDIGYGFLFSIVHFWLLLAAAVQAMRTCGTSKDIMLGLTAAILLLSFLARADAHGSLISPRSRNEIFFNGQWAATAGNGIGQRLGACQGPPPFGAPPGFCLPAGQPGRSVG